MARKRSASVTFWGYLVLLMGVVYGLASAARNIWRIDYVALPIIYVTVGLGILSLKNWARWVLLALLSITLLTGILRFPEFLRSMSELSKDGLFLPGFVALALRFIVSLGGILFFVRRSVGEQFKSGGKQ